MSTDDINNAENASGDSAPRAPWESAADAGSQENVPTRLSEPISPEGGRGGGFAAGVMGDEDLTGRRLGAYCIQREIGRGGMGVVYEALDETLHRRTALKVISLEWCAQRDFIARFMREARVAARVMHPNLVTVYAAGCDQGRHYLAMEIVDGMPLAKKLEDRQPLPVEEALHYTWQAAEGLAAIHENGIIHRDIKPGNLLLDAKGRVRLTDYGLAKPIAQEVDPLTTTPMIMGTFPYISPEQCESGEAVPASDVYALGITLYQMLTGRHPYSARRPRELLQQIQSGPPPLDKLRMGIPQPVASVLQKMMASSLDERYATAREAADALAACLRYLRRDEEIDTQPMKTAKPASEAAARWRSALSNAAALALFVIALYWAGEPGVKGGFQALWHSIADAKYLAMPDAPPHPSVHLIDLGGWPPEDTDMLSALINELARQEAAVIGLDIDLAPPLETIRLKDPESLAPAIRDAGNVVMVSRFEKGEALRPVGALAGAASALGFANLPPSVVDGRIRETVLTQRTNSGETAMSFALVLGNRYARARQNEDAGAFPSWLLQHDPASLLATRRIDYSPIDRMPVEHLPPTIEAVDNLSKGFNKYRGKAVIVGTSKTEDWHFSPAWGEAVVWEGKRGHIPGLVLQGLLLDNLLASRTFRAAPWWMAFALALGGIVLAFVLGAVFGPRALGFLWIGLIVLYLAAGMGAMRYANVALPDVWPILVWTACAAAGAWRSKALWKRFASQ